MFNHESILTVLQKYYKLEQHTTYQKGYKFDVIAWRTRWRNKQL